MDPEHFDINADKRLGARERAFVDNLARLRAEANFLREVMDKLVSAGAFNYVADAFGTPEGSGQALYNLHSGAMGELNGVNIAQFLARLG